MPLPPREATSPFEIRPLSIALFVEGTVPGAPPAREPERVRGYALAIGWWPAEDRGRRRPGRSEPPEVLFLVADPQRAAPVWVSEQALDRHFRSYTRAPDGEAHSPGEGRQAGESPT